MSRFEKRFALSVPYDFPLATHMEIAPEMERLGYRDAWSLEVDQLDIFVPLAAIASRTTMRLGTAIANVYTRSPTALAQSAAAMNELAPGRFVLGVGSGSEVIVEGWNGLRFEKPVTRVRETVAVLRQALSGEKVDFEGKTLRVSGYRMSRPPANPIPIHVAALRAGMLKAAGEVADGVCVNWLSAEDVRKSVAVVREAARAAGRDPEAIEVTARLMLNIDPPGEEQQTQMRRHICAYLNVPVYKEFHQWLGRGEALGGMWQSWESGDRRGAVAAIPERTVGELIIHGTREEQRAHIRRYLEAGVDTAFLQLASSERDPGRRAELLVSALRELAPAL